MLLSILSALALSQQPAPPSCEGEAYDDFDFWAGRWDVHNPQGQKVGENVIAYEEEGCLLVERWTAANGTTGQSYNYYDPAKDRWRQVWVARGSIIDYEGGLDEDGAMALEGTLTPRAGGKPQPFRGRWTPRDDGSVQQTFWLRNTESGEWDVWFDGNYRRQSD